MYKLLKALKNTSSGPDDIPVNILKDFSPELTEPITFIFNMSLAEQCVPDIFKCANVVPVPKVPSPGSPDELRPISVTPILARVLERLVVNRYLRSAISAVSGQNQYGFKEKSSTETALLDIQHFIGRSLDMKECKAVRMFTVDFKKAFDNVTHTVLFQKLDELDIPIFVKKWIKNFLTGRKQRVKVKGMFTNWVFINRGVPQGTVLGPFLFILYIASLTTKYSFNQISKFADDCTLLIPVLLRQPDTSEEEIRNILAWCFHHGMQINFQKTKEVVISLRRLPGPVIPVMNIEQVDSVKLLGVVYQRDSKFDIHISKLVSTCQQHLFLLKNLKRLGLSTFQLKCLTNAWIDSRVFYCSTLFGNISKKQLNSLQSVYKKCNKWGICDAEKDIGELLRRRDKRIFNSMLERGILQQYHPAERLTQRNTRSSAYRMKYFLPRVNTEHYKSLLFVKQVFETRL